MRLFDRNRLSDPDWLVWQLAWTLTICAVAGGIALLLRADLVSVRGVMLGVAGLGFILLAVVGVRSYMRGDWDGDD